MSPRVIAIMTAVAVVLVLVAVVITKQTEANEDRYERERDCLMSAFPGSDSECGR